MRQIAILQIVFFKNTNNKLDFINVLDHKYFLKKGP